MFAQGCPVPTPSGQVVFDAVTPSTSASWTHTPVGVPTGVAVLAQIYSVPAGTQGAITATYGGVPMTLAVTENADSGTTQPVLFGLSNPPPGPQTVVVTYAGLGAIIAYSVSVTGGVTSGSPFSNTNAATGTNNSPAISVNGALGELAIDLSTSISTETLGSPGAAQTQRGNQSIGFATAGISTQPGAASASFTWALTGTSGQWNELAASFRWH